RASTPVCASSLMANGSAVHQRGAAPALRGFQGDALSNTCCESLRIVAAWGVGCQARAEGTVMMTAGTPSPAMHASQEALCVPTDDDMRGVRTRSVVNPNCLHREASYSPRRDRG